MTDLTSRGRHAVAGALRRWRRWRFRGTVNAPYLSGDFFRSCCDLALEDRTDRAMFAARVAGARSLFVKTDHAAEFFERFAPVAEACRVLITGNSDLEIHRVPAGLPPALGAWFAQNACVAHPLLRPLPIGLENQALGVNGVRALYRACTAEEIARKSLRVLVGFWSGRTPERADLVRRARTAPAIEMLDRRLTPAAFQRRLRQHRFVLAPRGNGIDTHRFWEALYADAIPVTTQSTWSDAFAGEGVPFLAVKTWDDVFDRGPADWERCSREFPLRPSALAWLWAPFWTERLTAQAQPSSGAS